MCPPFICSSLCWFVSLCLCSVWYVNSVLISLSCSPLVRLSSAEANSAVFVMLIHQWHNHTQAYTHRYVFAHSCTRYLQPHSYSHIHTAVNTQGLSKTAEAAEADHKSVWQAASHGVLLTFSPIALSLLTLHAPPCCSDLIGLELTVRPGGQDDCVSAHGAHLISVGSL